MLGSKRKYRCSSQHIVMTAKNLDSFGIDLRYPMGCFDLSPLFIGMSPGRGVRAAGRVIPRTADACARARSGSRGKRIGEHKCATQSTGGPAASTTRRFAPGLLSGPHGGRGLAGSGYFAGNSTDSL